MTFNQLIRALGVDPVPYIELGMNDVLFVERTTVTEVMFSPDRLTKVGDKAKKIIEFLGQESFLMKLECFLTCEILGKGPKIFRPTSTQLSMLEKMNLNIEVRDFHAPFTTMLIELPEEYRLSKEGQPHCVALHIDKSKNLFLCNMMYDREAVKSWWCPTDDDMMEGWFVGDYKEYETDIYTTSAEYSALESIKRAALNYCLLLDEVGIKPEGPATPNEYSQLVKWCAKKNKHTRNNKIQLTGQGMRFGLKTEEIVLHRTAESTGEPGDPSGRTMPYHTRRGHYKMQPHGPGNTLRKRIRIPPTIINKHLLVMPLTQTYRS